jgi:hypothetical protein
MATGFPVKGTGGSTTYSNGSTLSASDLNDGFGTLNLLKPTAKGSIFAASAASTPSEVLVGNGVALNIGQVLVADASQTTGIRWADDVSIFKIMDAI